MRAKTIAAVLAAAAIVAVCAPGGALGRPSFHKLRGESTESIELRATNGYHLLLSVVDRRANVTFEKATGHGGVDLVTYDPRRRVAPGPDLHFRVGGQGEVDLRFVAEKRRAQKMAGCTGGPAVTETGHFVGRIRIRGRQGFSSVDAHRADGVVSNVPSQECRRRNPRPEVDSITVTTSSSRRPTVPKGALELIAGNVPRGVRFEALSFGGETDVRPDQGTFDASVERRGRYVTTAALVIAEGSRHGFVSPEPGEPLRAAAISPPAPFSGTATFAMTSPRHGEWSGDLAVEFPGFGRMPLTGPKTVAGLCETEACTPTLPKWLRPRTGPEPNGAGAEFEGNFFGE